jgi:hypothetical protein
MSTNQDMSGNEDVSLFIGMLPGADQRQLVLFPGGHVLADVRDEEIETAGYVGSDRGMIAASALIGALRDSGWYVEEMPNAGAVWLKPGLSVPASVEKDDGEVAGAHP